MKKYCIFFLTLITLLNTQQVQPGIGQWCETFMQRAGEVIENFLNDLDETLNEDNQSQLQENLMDNEQKRPSLTSESNTPSFPQSSDTKLHLLPTSPPSQNTPKTPRSTAASPIFAAMTLQSSQSPRRASQFSNKSLSELPSDEEKNHPTTSDSQQTCSTTFNHFNRTDPETNNNFEIIYYEDLKRPPSQANLPITPAPQQGWMSSVRNSVLSTITLGFYKN